jgi:tetratricopeptide (TPR) repeat protein
MLLAGWIEASSGDLDAAQGHLDAASSLAVGDMDLEARCAYYRAYVASHRGDFQEALALTRRSRALYDPLDRPWDQAANALFAARAAISSGDEPTSVAAVAAVERWLKEVEDPWLLARAEAVRGELARMQHRFPAAVTHLSAAVDASRRLGFLQTEAYQLSSLGRALCQEGDYSSGVVALRTSIDKAERIGDVRLAALARVHLGRALRATGDEVGAREALERAAEWHRRAGGGEQALLGECLLAALDADRDSDVRVRLRDVLTEARRLDAHHVAVFALDALAAHAAGAGESALAAAMLAEADRQMASVSHFITEQDRVDAKRVRQTQQPAPFAR